MITTVQIKIIKAGKKQTVQLICDNSAVSITFTTQPGINKIYSDSDFYQCFGKLRKDNPDLQFLCKGAKLNVHPSSMSSQMTLGLKAYELVLGEAAELGDLVYIFDYEEDNLTNKPEDQRAFFMKWIKSEKAPKIEDL
ncbi:hypothetical protein ACYZT9_18605 [Pseudomonas sp. ZT5P21]